MTCEVTSNMVGKIQAMKAGSVGDMHHLLWLERRRYQGQWLEELLQVVAGVGNRRGSYRGNVWSWAPC